MTQLDITSLLGLDVNERLLTDQLTAALSQRVSVRVQREAGKVVRATLETAELIMAQEETIIFDVVATHDPAQLTTDQVTMQATRANLEWAAGILAKLDTSKDLTARADFPDIIKALVIAARGG
jgi:hypothetical protein